MKQDQTRSELQERIAADLRAKAAASSHTGDGAAPASVEQSEYLKGTKQTTTLAGVWLVVGFLALLTFGFFVALTINGQQ